MGIFRESQPAFITPGYLFATILIVGLFFMWGVANSLNDVLIPQFRKAFQLDDFASSLVQSAFYFGYFCFAIPASLFMRRFGYRAAVLLGLALYGAGALLFLPAAHSSQYYAFLLALYVIASGLAFLETSANPLIAVMGPSESADQRLNFAQTFNPIGTMSGSYIGGMLIFSDVHYTPEQLNALTPAAFEAFRAAELASVKLPYVCIAALVIGWALLVLFAKFPPVDRAQAEGGFAGLAKFPRYWLGVFAQFAYVGAQVGVWSFLIRYTQHNFPGRSRKSAALVADFLRHLLCRPAHRHAADVALQPGEAAGHVRRHQRGVVPGCRGGGRRLGPLCPDRLELLHVHHVSDHLLDEPARARRVHQVGRVVPRHGHHRRRGVHRHHGSRVA